MDPQKLGRAKKFYSWHEAFDQITASDEDSVHSSGPDSADSGDEADFIAGIDPSIDIVDDVKEEDMEVSISGGSAGGRRRSRPPETLPGDEAGWKTEEDPDDLPCPPPRFFPKRRPGVQPPLSECADSPSPSELFRMFLDRAAVRTLCANTNKNAAKNIAAGKKFKWTEVTEAEMYQYVGLTLYMGVLKLPKRTDFWRTGSIFCVPYPQRVMSRIRFLNIAGNVHLSDPAGDALNDSRKGTDDYDRLHRIRPLYDSLRAACRAAYHPQQNLSVDERMVAAETRMAPKQCARSKSRKWGVKLFALSDVTGYTVDFNVYTGKSARVTGKGLSFDAVTSLIDENFLGSGYHVYCDHFYTSPALFRHLHALGFGACGTFRDTGRAGIPRTKLNALTRHFPRGSIRWIRDGALLFVKWMDRKEVSVCSTLHAAFSGDTVRRACEVRGKRKAVDLPVPSAVKDYGSFKRRMDLTEQLIGSSSSPLRKTRKWYVTVLHHFINIAVTNSYLLHKDACSRLELERQRQRQQQGQQPMTHRAFVEQLTAELCGVPPQSSAPDTEQHIPVAIVEGASGSKKATQGRRKCRMCGKCTPFMCEECRVALCVIVDRNCHKAFHSFTGAPL